MEIVLLGARLLLAGVFGVAGVAKAADIAASKRAVVGFGLSEALARPIARILPVAEILIALALIPVRSAWVGALAASGLLFVFTVAIVVNLARGRNPECHCFGQLHSTPVGWSTVARNLALLAFATVVIAQGRGNSGLSALDWLGDLKGGEILTLVLSAVLVLMLAVTVTYLRRVMALQSTVLEKLDSMKKVIDEDYAEPPIERDDAVAPAAGLPIGAPAPDFSLKSIAGEDVTLDDLLEQGRSLLLVFISPNCAPCKALLPTVADWQRDYRDELTVALLTKGDSRENQRLLAESGATYLLLQGDSGVAEDFEARWTPAAVMIRPDGKIASPVTYGDEAIREMVGRSVRSANNKAKRGLEIKENGHRPQITIGTPHSAADLGKLAPSFSLPDLRGGTVRTEDLLGRDTLLLFWDPQCPYCGVMTDDILDWEESPPRRAPRLVIVSSGSEESVRAESEKFASQFLHDSKFEVGPLFGTNATPTAVLIDREGRIASPPTGGRADILALAGVRKTTTVDVRG